MIEMIVSGLLGFSALGCGLIGGLYFTFSAFGMRALDSLPPAEGASAMIAINRDILRSLFLPLFMLTTLVSLGLTVAALMTDLRPRDDAIIAAGLIYCIGMTAVTMAFNVPLNNALAQAGPGEIEGVWARYVRTWTAWNHLRLAACVVSSSLYILAL